MLAQIGFLFLLLLYERLARSLLMLEAIAVNAAFSPPSLGEPEFKVPKIGGTGILASPRIGGCKGAFFFIAHTGHLAPLAPQFWGEPEFSRPPVLGDLGGFHRLVHTRHLAPLAPQLWREPQFSRPPELGDLGGFQRLV